MKSFSQIANPRAAEYSAFGRAVWAAYQKYKSKVRQCANYHCNNSFVAQFENSDQSFCCRSCGNAERARERVLENAKQELAMDIVRKELVGVGDD